MNKLLIVLLSHYLPSIFSKLQQEQVSEGLHWYINQQPPPVDDAAVAMETLEYLEACNLFERGFFSHDHVHSIRADVLMMDLH